MVAVPYDVSFCPPLPKFWELQILASSASQMERWDSARKFNFTRIQPKQNNVFNICAAEERGRFMSSQEARENDAFKPLLWYRSNINSLSHECTNTLRQEHDANQQKQV